MTGAASRPGRLSVGVVGAGRVGAPLGAALAVAGHTVVAASGVSEASVTRIEALLPGAQRTDPESVVRAADLVLLTVPDDALADLVAGLAAVGAWRPGQIVIHTSGVQGLDALAPAAAVGALGLAIHPAMTFTGTSLDLQRIQQAHFAVTAPPAMLAVAQALVVEMGGEAVVVADDRRVAYHAALVHGANHVATAVAQASALLAEAGVEEPAAVLQPLVLASVDGALADAPGSMASLTGPVVRGDVGTVRAHLAAIDGSGAMDAAYRAMARATADLAHASGRLKDAAYAEVMDVLEEQQ